MSRIINSDHGSPNISNAKFIGQSERLFCVCFISLLLFLACSGQARVIAEAALLPSMLISVNPWLLNHPVSICPLCFSAFASLLRNSFASSLAKCKSIDRYDSPTEWETTKTHDQSPCKTQSAFLSLAPAKRNGSHRPNLLHS